MTPAYSPMSESIESYRVIEDRAIGDEVIETPSGETPQTPTTMRLPADAAMLVVELPESARVYVNGSLTSASGSLRRFVSRGLEAGKDYEFVVRMVSDDGSPKDETRVVSLRGGEIESVSFDDTAAGSTATLEASAELTTGLILHVPADAAVWLAGNATISSGETRVFETTSLRHGQAWSAYEVRVTTTIDGRIVEAKRLIDLEAGNRLELELGPAGDSLVVTGEASSDDTASL